MRVLYESHDFLVIDKPVGLVVHSDGRTDEATVVDWLLETYPDIAGVGEDWEREDGSVIPRPGIVHRLDRDTSGAMIIARTQAMFDHLKEQFQNHAVGKEYHALCYGHPKNDTGTIDASIGKSRKNFRMWSAGRGARGQLRKAVTDYTVLKRFMKNKTPFSYLLFEPQTGRTHQIRVHAKYLNHPLVADELYAGKNIKQGTLGFDRQALHARAVSFQDLDGTQHRFEAPFPHDFEKVLHSKEYEE